ncbi:MAG: response regulator [Butyrivibrio sp.]|uniref:response regulator transcription factor n=1 Tax=Butyrivibrio sp. TaxID=28121 RepID=UPI001B0F957B|nr:response regulator [Butyrivibrio sp.]MBO6240979.1 response regulator [Butyrivibrio sp.]
MYHAVIIDDEKWVVKSLIATIKDQSMFDITAEFYNGTSGLEYIRTRKPDLAFVDIRMPGMGGLDILQTTHAEGLPTLFIMISGHAEFAYAQKAMFHNAIGYCLKPFSKSELIDAMNKAYIILDSKINAPSLENSSQENFVPKHLSVSHKSVKMMIDYAEAHFQEDISMHDISQYCSINPNYASQIFKQETGQSFISYLNNLRIVYACYLLEHSEDTVFEISEKAGFNDYFYFAKVFKKIKGDTPTNYRKSLSLQPQK